jgi:hypothetical protein
MIFLCEYCLEPVVETQESLYRHRKVDESHCASQEQLNADGRAP